MYTVRWINHGYNAEKRFDTVETAIAFGKSVYFEFAVHDAAEKLIAAWGPFSGLRYYDDVPPHRDDGSLAEFDRYIAGDR